MCIVRRADTAVVQHRANFAGLIVGGPAAAVALERVEFREITGTGVSSAAMQVRGVLRARCPYLRQQRRFRGTPVFR